MHELAMLLAVARAIFVFNFRSLVDNFVVKRCRLSCIAESTSHKHTSFRPVPLKSPQKVFVMNKLSGETVRLISSTQVITSVSSVVKELVENSIDAFATSVDVKLDNYGLEKVEVRDNGRGIKVCDVPFAGQRHYTSKIETHDDLQLLSTYGFRGEALGSLCELADVSLCTRTKDELHSTLYNLDKQGKIVGSKPSHAPIGTTVIAKELFKNLPVRKQFYNSMKKKKEQLKLIEDYLMSVSLAYPQLQVRFTNNKLLVWQKPKVSTLRAALISVLTTSVAKNLVEVKMEDGDLSVHMFLPESLPPRKTSDRTFLIINNRPVRDKEIDKLLKASCNAEDTTGWPVSLVVLQVPTNTVDANVNANKTQVMLSQKDKVLDLITRAFDRMRKSKSEVPNNASQTEDICVDVRTNFDLSVDVEETTKEPEKHSNAIQRDSPHIDSCRQELATFNDSNSLNTISHSPENEQQLCNSSLKNVAPQTAHRKDTDDMTVANGLSDASATNQSSHSERNQGLTIIPNSPRPRINNAESTAVSSAELWSKGKTNEEKTVQPVKLATVANIDSNTSKTPSRKRSFINSMSNQSTLDGLLTPSCKKPRSVFEIDEDFENLPPEKQKDCISAASSEWDDYQKKQKSNTAKEKESKKHKPRERRSFLAEKRFIDDDNDEVVEVEADNSFPVAEEVVEAQFGTLKNNVYEIIMHQQDKKHSHIGKFDFIGHLMKKGCVVCRYGPSLFIANLMRLCENAVFKSLIQKHVLQCTDFDNPLMLDDKVLGSEALEVLDNLKATPIDCLHPDAEILDSRITSNGFKVLKILEEQTARMLYQLKAMTLSVSYYSVQDLKGILLKIHKNNEITVAECRPPSVFQYLQGEAARIAWGNPLPDSEADISNMILQELRQTQSLDEFFGLKCFHMLPVFHKLANLKRYKV